MRNKFKQRGLTQVQRVCRLVETGSSPGFHREHSPQGPEGVGARAQSAPKSFPKFAIMPEEKDKSSLLAVIGDEVNDMISMHKVWDQPGYLRDRHSFLTP